MSTQTGDLVVPDDEIKAPPPTSEKPTDVGSPPPEEEKQEEAEPEPQAEPEPEIEAEKPRHRSGHAREKARRLAAEARAEKAEADLARAKEAPIEKLQRPKMEQFTSIEDYENAVDRYHDARAKITAREVADENWQRSQQAKIAEEKNENVEDFKERWEDFSKKVPDANALIDKLHVSIGGGLEPVVRDLIAEADNGEYILYYLAKNPSQAIMLNQSDPLSAAKMIGRLEAITALPKGRTETKAPPPIKQVKGGAAPPRDFMQAAKSDNIADYVKMRKAMQKKD